MTSDEKKIITPPDYDYSRGFKILLVDFEWPEITNVAEAMKTFPGPMTLFLYGSNDSDPKWCIAQAKQCNSVLLNMNHIGNCETLKGYLMGEPNVFSFGSHHLKDVFQRNVLDTMSWLANSYQNFHKQHDETQSR